MKRMPVSKSEIAELEESTKRRRSSEGSEVTVGMGKESKRVERSKFKSFSDEDLSSDMEDGDDSGKESNDEIEEEEKIRGGVSVKEEKQSDGMKKGYLGDNDETLEHKRHDYVEVKDIPDTKEVEKQSEDDETEEENRDEPKPTSLDGKLHIPSSTPLYVSYGCADPKKFPSIDQVTGSSQEAHVSGKDFEVQSQHEVYCRYTLENFEWRVGSLSSLDSIQTRFEKAKVAALKPRRKGRKNKNLFEKKIDTTMNPAVEEYLVSQRELMESMKSSFLAGCVCPQQVTSCTGTL